MSLSRALYVGQTVQFITANGTGPVYYFPVSSASCEVSSPIEAVTTFGHLNSLTTAQTNLTTCKSSIKSYLGTGYSPIDSTGQAGTGFPLGITATALNALTGDAVNNTPTVISVYPFGFTMSGIVSSVGVDISMGGFGMCDLTFNGVGTPVLSVPGNTATDQAAMPNWIQPVTTVSVSGSITSGFASSFKFSLDMPTETLSCLGDIPNAIQGTPAFNSIISTKPPYKTNITVEGYGVNVNTTGIGLTQAESINAISGSYILGALVIQLPHPNITSRSFNNAVGAAGATYNYVLEDVGVTFSELIRSL